MAIIRVFGRESGEEPVTEHCDGRYVRYERLPGSLTWRITGYTSLGTAALARMMRSVPLRMPPLLMVSICAVWCTSGLLLL